jgi:2-phosphoglycerate kinase
MVGKSTIARKIAARLEYGCISTDDVGLAIKTVTTAETHPRSHSMDGIDYREYYINRSVEELLVDGMGMHEEMWPGIEASIRAHADWSFPVIYEGWALWPERVADLLDELDNVSAVWLTASDDFLEVRVRSTERFYTGASDQEMMIQKYLPRNIEYNRLMMEAVNRLDLEWVKVDSNKSLEDIADQCFAQLGFAQLDK